MDLRFPRCVVLALLLWKQRLESSLRQASKYPPAICWGCFTPQHEILSIWPVGSLASLVSYIQTQYLIGYPLTSTYA